jgi:hypothetical protein
MAVRFSTNGIASYQPYPDWAFLVFWDWGGGGGGGGSARGQYLLDHLVYSDKLFTDGWFASLKYIIAFMLSWQQIMTSL